MKVRTMYCCGGIVGSIVGTAVGATITYVGIHLSKGRISVPQILLNFSVLTLMNIYVTGIGVISLSDRVLSETEPPSSLTHILYNSGTLVTYISSTVVALFFSGFGSKGSGKNSIFGWEFLVSSGNTLLFLTPVIYQVFRACCMRNCTPRKDENHPILRNNSAVTV